nr:MAG TPA: hypothetical protein [Caudoviricetes sp.]
MADGALLQSQTPRTGSVRIEKSLKAISLLLSQGSFIPCGLKKIV